MAKKKSILIDFVKSCITYNKLNKIAMSGIESIYDVINGRFAIPSKRPSGKKSSSKRVVKCDTVFVAYRFCGHSTEEQASDLNQNIGDSRFMWNRMLSDYKLMWKMYGISTKNGEFRSKSGYKREARVVNDISHKDRSSRLLDDDVVNGLMLFKLLIGLECNGRRSVWY